jgi:aminoglycoside phosphotransferase (APT) family kinase protein
MLVQERFLEANWLRDTRQCVQAKVLVPFLKEVFSLGFPHVFGAQARVMAHEHQGWCNLSYLVSNPGGEEYILRLQSRPPCAARERWSVYHKEAWAMQSVPSDVPVARVMKAGVGYITFAAGPSRSLPQYAFMLQSRVAGEAADVDAGWAARLELLEQLGRIANSINCTPTRGYGAVFCAEDESFAYASWQEYLQAEIVRQDLPALVVAGVLSAQDAQEIRRRLEGLARLDGAPRLAHMDFVNNWKNVLVSSSNRVRAVIDWEFAFSGPAAHYEIASTLYAMYRDGEAPNQRAAKLGAFLKGYGLSLEEYRASYAEDVETIMILNALNAVNKFLALRALGQLGREPWRRRFAARARRLIEQLCCRRRTRTWRSTDPTTPFRHAA